MFRFTLSTSVLMTAMSLFTASASAQGFGSVQIQNDYNRYAQLFKAGREPDLSPTGSDTWRKLYRDHNWKGYAEGTEHREPLLAAQVLMGIYLIQHVDHQLSYTIENIILDKPLLTRLLAETVTLDRIAAYMSRSNQGTQNVDQGSRAQGSGASGLTFYTEDVIKKLAEEIDPVARKKMVAGVSRNFRAEVIDIQNLFRQREKGWITTYLFMREKFLVLDALRDMFIPVSSRAAEKREEILKLLMESDEVKWQVEARIRDILRGPRGSGNARAGNNVVGGNVIIMPGDDGDDWIDGQPGGEQRRGDGMNEEEIEKLRETLTREISEDIIKSKDARSIAHKYIVGVYQSSGYHLETLHTIYSYYRQAAEQGCPMAQYHLALFLMYLGEFVLIDDEDKNDAIHDVFKCLNQAAMTDLARKRVEELRDEHAAEIRRAESRAEKMNEKIRVLVQIENEKIDMIHEVLIKIAERVGKADAIAAREREEAFKWAQLFHETQRVIAPALINQQTMVMMQQNQINNNMNLQQLNIPQQQPQRQPNPRF